jgi:simple sugar transport system permease protein
MGIIWNADSMLGWIVMAVNFGSVILYGAMGEILTEKAGHLNLGVPGIMLCGGISGFASTFLYEQSTENPSKFVMLLLGLVSSVVAATLAGLIYAFLTITLKANQNVTGITLTTFGAGLAKHFGSVISAKSGSTAIRSAVADDVFNAKIPFLSTDLGVVGKLLFNYGFLVYLAVILAVLLQLFFYRTHQGLNLRAIGENPGTADAMGINVTRYKYSAILAGSAISGIGGFLYLVINNVQWSTALDIEGMGWLAVALVIFATWKPVNAIWGGYLFGFLSKAGAYAPTFITGITISQNIWSMTPYIVTIVVLIAVSFRMKKESRPPAALGTAYFREDR